MIRAIAGFAYILMADAVVFLAGLPLQRYALHVAMYESHDKLRIIALLGLNGVLLVLIVTASLAGLSGIRMVVDRVIVPKKPRCTGTPSGRRFS